MTLRELLFDSLESFEHIHIDYGKYTKELTNELYDILYDEVVEKWYLIIKNNLPIMIIKLEEN